MTRPFEDKLLAELQAMVVAGEVPQVEVATAPPARGRVALAGAAAVLVLAAAALTLPAVFGGNHGAAAAYAVSRHQDGTVSLAVRGAVANPADMQASLRSAGVQVHVFGGAYRGACHPAHDNQPQPTGLVNGLGPDRFVIDPSRLVAGTQLVAQLPAETGGPLRFSVSRDGRPACPR